MNLLRIALVLIIGWLLLNSDNRLAKPLQGVKIGTLGITSRGGDRIQAGMLVLSTKEEIVKKLTDKGAGVTGRIDGPLLQVDIRWVYLSYAVQGLSIALSLDPRPLDGIRAQSRFVSIPLENKTVTQLAQAISEAVYEFLRDQPKAVNKKGSSLTGRAFHFL